MSFIWKSLKWIAALFAILIVVYLLGPRPAKPTFTTPNYTNAASLAELELEISKSEATIKGLKPGNEANIVWANPTIKGKTPVVFLYLHGFGASHHEGYPVDVDLAKRFGCNIFLSRLSEHGIEAGDDNLKKFTADSYAESGERALHIAKQLGDSVVILATSGGAAVALLLASKHPEIKALVTYSPAIQIFRKDAAVMSGPWGLQLARLITGKNYNDWTMKDGMAPYWTNHQSFEGVVQFSTFLKYANTPENFAKIKCPFFMAYYYDDEAHQDFTVSVAAMKEMYAALGTPSLLKREVSIKNADSHVITSDITCKLWSKAEAESALFIHDVLGMELK